MRIVIFGANGQVGKRLAAEALRRGHHVTAVTRDGAAASGDARAHAAQGDAADAASVARLTAGADAAINAISPRPSPQGRAASSLDAAARALTAGCVQSGCARLLVVGGAGSLEVAPAVQLVDTAQFPEAYKAEALAARAALAVYRSAPASLAWTYVSPPALLLPGERTGRYRRGGDQLLTDGNGESRISMEDFAVALLDEVEKPTAPRRRITVAY